MPPAIESGRTTPYDAAVAKLSEVYEAVSPYAVKALHIGWVPFIIGLALVSTEPRPNLLQMVTPM